MRKHIKNNLVLKLEEQNKYCKLNLSSIELFNRRVTDCIKKLHKENVEDKIYYSYLKIKYSLELCEKDAKQEQKILLDSINTTLGNIKVENDALKSISSYISKDKKSTDHLIDVNIYTLLLQICLIHDSRDYFVESAESNYFYKNLGLKTFDTKRSDGKIELHDIKSKIKELTKG